MLNADIKRQINTVRDILVGKIPDPKGQIDQITNALIYKFMDDQDRIALTLPHGKATFFVGDLEPFAWHKLFDSKLSNQDRANLYVEGIAMLSKAKNLPELFREVFKDAFLPFRAPDTIAMFLDEINKFDYQHSEDLGNAFEYLLSIMGSQGDAGQFRTPRNIIEFIVDAVNPTKDESILDPACGTAGFLVEAYKHITEGSKLSQNEIQELSKHIHGVDIDPGMAKIARVNLYLHGFKTPLITENDTLSNEKLWGTKYDVILANPPFMTPRGGIRPHDKFSVHANKAEVLFTDYIAEHLKLSGRAGIVVPEGIIFQSSNAYKQLRKMLVEDNYLWAVISLPAGVFNPYSGVKTSILFLDRKRASENDEILFYKVENDGFDLGAQRRKIPRNDLPEALEVIKQWKESKKVKSEKALYIKREAIAIADGFNLSGDRHNTLGNQHDSNSEKRRLGDLASILNGYSFKSELYSADGTRVIRITNVQKGKIVDDSPKFYDLSSTDEIGRFLLEKDDLLISLTGNVGRVGLLGQELLPAALNQRVGCIRIREEEHIYKSFLFHILNSEIFEEMCISASSGVAQKNLSTEWLKEVEIPLPSLEFQNKIVEELDGYKKMITGAKQIKENWKPRIEIQPEWEKIDLGKIAKFKMGGTPSQSEINSQNANISWVKGSDLSKGYIYETENFISNDGMKNSRARVYEVNTILVGRTGQGKTRGTVAILKIKATTNETMIGIFPDIARVDSEYLYNYLISQYQRFRDIGGDNQRGGITQQDLDKFAITLPPIETQKQIVEKIEAERALVESAKKLIEIYEQKTKDLIARLWKE